MADWREGDQVRVVRRPVTEEDRKSFRYFEHMAGLVGTVQTAYSKDEVAVKVSPDTIGDVTASVLKNAVERMREKFLASIGEEQKKMLSPEELRFDNNYVVLVRSTDLERI